MSDDCTRISELLAAFADGGLETDEAKHVAAHVASCSSCAADVHQIRRILRETRTSGAPEPKDERFWQDFARDIRLAVGTAQPARPAWWRLPVVAFGFAAAAAAVLYVYVQGPGAQAPMPVTASHSRSVLPATYELEDLDATQLEAVHAALEGLDDEMTPPDDDELATTSPEIAETLVESLDEEDMARVHAAL